MRKTFVIVKPDAVNRSLIGRVITRFEEKGLRIAALKMAHLKGDIIDEHYSHIADKPFFAEIRNYISSIPCVLMIVEGKDAVNVVRKLVGVTCGREADIGTIRGDFSMSVQSNIVHASEDEAAAEVEIKRFFKDDEIMDYQRIDYNLIYTEMEKEPFKKDDCKE
jgi:nucleoside-diphosphate kinase